MNAPPTLCYLYFDTTTLSALETTPLFETTSLCASNTTSFPKAWVYLVELDTLTKKKLALLGTLAKRHKTAHLYLLAPKELQQVILYKYALHVGVKEIFSPFATAEALLEALEKIHRRFLAELSHKQFCDLGFALEQRIPFVHYTHENPVFVSSAAKTFLGENVPALEAPLAEPFQLLSDASHQPWETFCYSFTQENDTFMFFFPYEKHVTPSHIARLHAKDEALAWLKTRLEKKENALPSFVTVAIDNATSLRKERMEVEYTAAEQLLREKLSCLCANLALFAQWEEDVYLLVFENHTAEALKTCIESFYTNCEEEPSLAAFVFSATVWHRVKEAPASAIAMLESMAHKSLESKEIAALDICILPSCGESLKEFQQILRTFYIFMVNKTPVKLQNIYKGLCINTASKIIKIKDKMVYFECQTLQGYAATESKKVVILSAELPFDIHGSVKFVNFEEKYLIADSFYFLPDSANSREYTRVQPSFRNPLYLKQGRVQIQGDILDISLKSIAFSTRQAVTSLVQNQTCVLTCKLPDSSMEEGFVEIRATGKVASQRPLTDTSTKIVVLLTLKDPYDAHLLRYMYMRQKELINELKQFTKNGQR